MKPTKKHKLIGWLALGYLITCLYYEFFSYILSEEYIASFYSPQYYQGFTDSDVGCTDDCLDSEDSINIDDSTTDYNIMETN